MDGALLVRECPDVSPRPLLRNAGLLEPLRPRDNVRSWLFPMTPVSLSLCILPAFVSPPTPKHSRLWESATKALSLCSLVQEPGKKKGVTFLSFPQEL